MCKERIGIETNIEYCSGRSGFNTYPIFITSVREDIKKNDFKIYAMDLLNSQRIKLFKLSNVICFYDDESGDIIEPCKFIEDNTNIKISDTCKELCKKNRNIKNSIGPQLYIMVCLAKIDHHFVPAERRFIIKFFSKKYPQYTDYINELIKTFYVSAKDITDIKIESNLFKFIRDFGIDDAVEFVPYILEQLAWADRVFTQEEKDFMKKVTDSMDWFMNNKNI